jgi:hypothetical protein
MAFPLRKIKAAWRCFAGGSLTSFGVCLMSPSSLVSIVLASSALLFGGADDGKTLATVAQAPAGVSPQIAGLINPQGFRVQGGEGTICEVWLLKDLAVKPKFKPSLNVKYPFTSGELVGVIRVGNKGEYTDFRGQPVKPGVYTLRYGQQPQDGNHIGTSELADFLVAIPVALDTDPKPVAPPAPLAQGERPRRRRQSPGHFFAARARGGRRRRLACQG